jgi:hypothetical protein
VSAANSHGFRKTTLYMPMQEELKAVSKCKNEVLVTILKYPPFFVVIVAMWSVTSSLLSF